jgi:glutathione S-transferase
MASSGPYTLYYWPEIPGRAEFVRLAFEAVRHPYTEDNDVGTLAGLALNPDATGAPPHFAPPVLAFPLPAGMGTGKGKGREGEEAAEGAPRAFLSQTPAILAYLGPRLGLVGDLDDDDEEVRELRRAHVNQLVLTALDLNNEAHDVRRPVIS